MLGTLIGVAVASKVIGTVAESVSEKKELERQQREEESRKASMRAFAQSNSSTMAMMTSEYYDLIKRNYLEVTHILMGMGFTNIHYKAKTIKEGWFGSHTEENTVYNVTINGSSEFEKGDVFAKGAYILVEINLFSYTPLPNLPSELTRNASSNSNAGNTSAGGQSAVAHKYCEYCGRQATINDYYCDGCGAPLK